MGASTRILFVRTDRLGEVLLNLPAVAAHRAASPGAHLTMLVRTELRSLLEGVPGIDRVLEYRDRARQPWWLAAAGLARRLRRERFDVAVVSNPSKELHVAVCLAGIPCRVGYRRKWGGLLTHRLEDRKALGERHEVEYNLDLVRALGWPTSAPMVPFARFEREQADIRHLLEQHGIRPSDPLIALHPWASNPRKRWPEDRYRALIRLAVERLAVKIVVIGGPEECPQAPRVLPQEVSIASLVGRLTLPQLTELLRRAQLLVSNDSGPMHLAAAVGTPVIALFGTTETGSHPRRWGPWGSGHTVIHKPLAALAVEEVLEAVAARLASTSPPSRVLNNPR